MLERAPVPQRWGRKLFWGFAAVELVILGLSYVGCNRLNNDSEFRYRCYKNYPTILEGYYWITKFGPDGGRVKELDLQFWKEQKRI